MSTEMLTAIISAITTLLVSLGTWHVSMRQHRLKTQQAMTEAIDDVKETVTENNAQIQQHISIIDLKIETLSDRVEKHNNLVERMYAVEKRTDLQDKDINYIKEKLA